jgi:hypothetical protein
MIKQQKMKIPVGGAKSKLTFNTDDNGKTFKVKIGSQTQNIKRSDLMGLMFLFADEKEQEDLVQAKEVKMKPILRLLRIKAAKDMKAGEELQTLYEYLLPAEFAELMIKAEPKKYMNSSMTEDEIKKKYPLITL